MRRKYRLLQQIDELRTSYWFVPGGMVLGAIALAISVQHLDARFVHDSVPGLRWLSTARPEGARSILATIAGSAITVTSVIFSITIVAISMASNQFGPRLIRNFMRSGGAQFALGLFLACFVYSLLMLGHIGGVGLETKTAYLSVAVGLVFGIACFLALIYYIHHVSTFIQAPHIIQDVTDDFLAAIARIYPPKEKRTTPRAAEDTDTIVTNRKCIEEVRCDSSGYVLSIAVDLLFKIATDHNATIDVQIRAGHFCVQGETLLKIYSQKGVDMDCRERCLGAVKLGIQRSPTEDPEFALNQLVEIGIRALSPGINDPFTAINCIDRMGAALVFLASRSLPITSLYDDGGVLRLRFVVDQYEQLVHSAFDQFRQHALGNAAVMIRLLEVIDKVARAGPEKEYAIYLKRQADLIDNAAGSLTEQYDRECMSRRYEAVRNSLGVVEGD